MDRRGDNSFYSTGQGGNSHLFPLNSPSWYTPTPHSSHPSSFVCEQSHQNSKNYNKTFIPSNAFGELPSSSRVTDSTCVDVRVPAASYFDMDQHLVVDDKLRKYPKIDFTNQVINPLNQIATSGSDTSRSNTKRHWTTEEDSKLNALVSQFGTKNWSLISELMENRAGKQCRERWFNNLRPDIKSEVWSEEEERILIEAHERSGNKWSQISKLLPGRTENAIKNHWNAATRKKTTRLNRNKKYEPNNTRPKSTLLRDYIRGMSSSSTTKTTNTNVTLGGFTTISPYEPPTSFSSGPSIDLIPYDQDFCFTTSNEHMVQALEPQLQSNVNPQGQHVLIEDRFDTHFNDNYQTATPLFSDAYLSRPVSEPDTFLVNSNEHVYAYGDMKMDLAFNAQGGGGFSSS